MQSRQWVSDEEDKYKLVKGQTNYVIFVYK